MLKRILIIGGVLLAAAVLAYSVLVYTEDIVSKYPTYADAVRAGAADRGWLPPFVPAGAFAIREVHNLDTNEQWLRFSVGTEDLASLRRELRPISLDEARAGHRKPRRWSGTWPPELDRFPMATPRGSLSFHEAADQHGRRWCLVVDRSDRAVHGWTCRPGP